MAAPMISIQSTLGNPIHLIDLLLALKPFLSDLEWEIDVECSLTPCGQALEAAQGQPRSTMELMAMSSLPHLQVIDGKLIGRGSAISLTIAAVDGQWWDVTTDSRKSKRAFSWHSPTLPLTRIFEVPR